MMHTTISFEDWLGDEGPRDEDEQNDLLQALREAGQAGRFHVDANGRGTTLVSGSGIPLKLLLTTEKAAYAFSKAVEGLTFQPSDQDNEDEDDPDVGYRQAVDGRYT